VDRELIFISAGFGDSALPYDQALALQRELHARRVDDEIPDVCLLLEHHPVYTAGRRTSPEDRPVGDPGAPVVDTDRGGRITWHGPGQLVGYPIVRLGDPVDVVAYVRSLEEAMIRACADFGLSATRVEGRSGAWVLGSHRNGDNDSNGNPVQSLNVAANVKLTRSGPDAGPLPQFNEAKDRKVAAIGIRVARGVTMHGFALNCNNDLSWFDRIVPCGIKDAAVTSLSAELSVGLGRQITVEDTIAPVQRHLATVLNATRTSELASITDLRPNPRPAAHTPRFPTPVP